MQVLSKMCEKNIYLHVLYFGNLERSYDYFIILCNQTFKAS